MRRGLLVVVGLAIEAPQWIALSAATRTYHVDPARSRATIHVGKAGAFSFIAGHSHEVGGPIEDGSVEIDVENPSRSHVKLVIAASALKVSAAGEPEGDPPKVQEAMDSEKVLDVARHQRITYESTGVTLKSRQGNVLEAVVSGQLTIRDVTQPVTASVRAELRDGALTASGHFTIKQTAFGIKPISVGGVVAVKDTLEIDFVVAATQQ